MRKIHAFSALIFPFGLFIYTNVLGLFPSLGFTSTKMGSFRSWVTSIFISGLYTLNFFLLHGLVVRYFFTFTVSINIF